MKKAMNYEAPVAEMIEMQASMVLMASGEVIPTPTPTPPIPTPPGPGGSGGTGGGFPGGMS